MTLKIIVMIIFLYQKFTNWKLYLNPTKILIKLVMKIMMKFRHISIVFIEKLCQDTNLKYHLEKVFSYNFNHLILTYHSLIQIKSRIFLKDPLIITIIWGIILTFCLIRHFFVENFKFHHLDPILSFNYSFYFLHHNISNY